MKNRKKKKYENDELLTPHTSIKTLQTRLYWFCGLSMSNFIVSGSTFFLGLAMYSRPNFLSVMEHCVFDNLEVWKKIVNEIFDSYLTNSISNCTK